MKLDTHGNQASTSEARGLDIQTSYLKHRNTSQDIIVFDLGDFKMLCTHIKYFKCFAVN